MLDHSTHTKKTDELKLHEDENWHDDKTKSEDMKYQINSNGLYEEEEEDEIFEDHKKEGI
jgi:hypothetical protein